MKNYDDLQRFKEKTHTLDIAFKDMSGQMYEAAEQSKWSLIRQLANDDASAPFSANQRVELPQPQPMRDNVFSGAVMNTAAQSHMSAAPAAKTAGGSLLASLAASLPQEQPATPASTVSSLFPSPSVEPPPEAPAQSSPRAASFPSLQPAPIFSAPPDAASAQHADRPGRFGGLFRTRNSEPASQPKETLLKPLLEKIALCR